MDEISRGGGCLACHLKYKSSSAHPVMTIDIDQGYCFGCHARSGRISANYLGLHQTHEVDFKKT